MAAGVRHNVQIRAHQPKRHLYDLERWRGVSIRCRQPHTGARTWNVLPSSMRPISRASSLRDLVRSPASALLLRSPTRVCVFPEPAGGPKQFNVLQQPPINPMLRGEVLLQHFTKCIRRLHAAWSADCIA